jgi:hypothetical protein
VLRPAGPEGPLYFDIAAPTGWTVVSNGKPRQTATNFAFEETKPIGTYLFAFAAGRFADWLGRSFRRGTSGGREQARHVRDRRKYTRSSSATPEALNTVDDFLAHNNADPDLRLKILEVRDELARTVRIRAK